MRAARQARTLGGIGGVALLLGLLPALPAAATPPPPPVSNIRVTLRTDHQLGITFDVPAVYYSPGVVGVVRITRGYTPAASPTAGYWVGVWNRTAETPTCPPFLTPDVVYTFAVWVNDHGTYSARRSFSVRTLKDTTPAALFAVRSLRSSIAEDGDPQVSLLWERACDEYAGVRIIRNTTPTLTGATVLWSDGNTHAYLDHGIPGLRATIAGQRVYYWLIGRDTAGNWGQHYTASSLVFGDRTITGHVSGTRSVDVFVACCANSFDNNPQWSDSTVVNPSVNNGDFALHVPAGWYGVCVSNHGATTAQDANSRCWVQTAGVYAAQAWDGNWENFPSAEIDLRSASTFGGIAF